jgi:hypothetical protein
MKKPHKSTFDAHDWHDRRCADSVPGFFGASLRVFPCGKKRDAIGKRPSLSHAMASRSMGNFRSHPTPRQARPEAGQLRTRRAGKGKVTNDFHSPRRPPAGSLHTKLGKWDE